VTQRSVGKEFQTTAMEIEKSLAPSHVLVARSTGVLVLADLRCLLDTDETGTKSSAKYERLYTVTAAFVPYVQNNFYYLSENIAIFPNFSFLQPIKIYFNNIFISTTSTRG